MPTLILMAAVLANSVLAAAPLGDQVVAPIATVSPAVPAGETVTQIVPMGTPVRLMFLKEITSRTAHKGDRFKLRVEEPVFINGKAVIPVGTAAWGEIVSLEPNGAAGHGGKLAARLLYVDLPDCRLPLKGEISNKGGGNGVAMAIVGFGILGLLNAGDSARFKAGDLLTAYVDDANAAKESAAHAES